MVAFFFFITTATTEIYTLSLHDALPIPHHRLRHRPVQRLLPRCGHARSEEHTSELQSLRHLVCRLLLEKKKACVILGMQGPCRDLKANSIRHGGGSRTKDDGGGQAVVEV